MGDLGWARSRAGHAVYGRTRGHTQEPGDPHLLSALVSGRESEEAGADGLHADTPHHSQCDGEEQDAVATREGTGLCRGIGDTGLDGDRRFYAKYVRRFFTGDCENTIFDS